MLNIIFSLYFLSYVFKDILSKISSKEEINSFFENLSITKDNIIKQIEKQTQSKSPINILADLGFLGADKQHENVVLAFKNFQKKEITDLQNKLIKVFLV